MELDNVNLKPLKEEMTQQGNDTKMKLDIMSAQLQEKDAALMKLGDRLNDKELENERLQKQLAECLKTQQNLTARNETGLNMMWMWTQTTCELYRQGHLLCHKIK